MTINTSRHTGTVKYYSSNSYGIGGPNVAIGTVTILPDDGSPAITINGADVALTPTTKPGDKISYTKLTDTTNNNVSYSLSNL